MIAEELKKYDLLNSVYHRTYANIIEINSNDYKKKLKYHDFQYVIIIIIYETKNWN